MISIVIAIVVSILAIIWRLQLHAERRDHRRTRRALTWWRDERCGHHGHGEPLYNAVAAGLHRVMCPTCGGCGTVVIKRDACPGCGGSGVVAEATGTPSEDGGEAFRTVPCEVCHARH